MIQPMLLKSRKQSEIPTLNQSDYLVYEKLDGFRCVWDKGKLYGRNSEKWDYYFPEIVQALQPYKDCVFDGELINSKGVSKPHLLQKRLVSSKFHIGLMSGLNDFNIPAQIPATFVVFDILEKGGEDYKQKPLQERQKALQDTISVSERVSVALPIDKPIREALNEVLANGGEGVVIKQRNSPYVETTSDKRTDYWYKVKRIIQEVVRFDGYEIQNAGITLTDSHKGFRCACNGHQSAEVKEQIDSVGFAFVEVNGLEITENDRIRQPTFSRLLSNYEGVVFNA